MSKIVHTLLGPGVIHGFTTTVLTISVAVFLARHVFGAFARAASFTCSQFNYPNMVDRCVVTVVTAGTFLWCYVLLTFFTAITLPSHDPLPVFHFRSLIKHAQLLLGTPPVSSNSLLKINNFDALFCNLLYTIFTVHNDELRKYCS